MNRMNASSGKTWIRSLAERFSFFGKPESPISGDRRRLLEQLPKNAVGAEIGVWRGEFSRHLLDVTRPRELHLIDPWQFQGDYPRRMYGGKVARSQTEMDAIYEEVRAGLSAPNVCFHRGLSSDVLKALPDSHLDWIYIDGNHSFEFVLEDLRLAARKVKPGGLISGDDYLWKDGEDRPVSRAVSVFLREAFVDPLRIDSQFLLRNGGANPA